MRETIKVQVGGVQTASSTYITKVLKPNSGILDQSNFQNIKTKYVIKWDYNLQNSVIHIPQDCLLEFDGGSIRNGVIDCDGTIIITYQDVDTVLKNVQLRGDYTFNSQEGSNLVVLSEDEYEELNEYNSNTVYCIKDENDDNSEGVVIYSGRSIKDLVENVSENKLDKIGNTATIVYPQNFVVQTNENSSTAKEELKNVKYEVRDSQGAKLFEFWAVVQQWQERPPQYTVTFNTNGGNNISSQIVETGTTITLPTPTKSGGYVFEGWYSNVELTGNKLTGSYTVTENITLHAKWKQVPLTVTMYSFDSPQTNNFNNSNVTTILTYNSDTEVSENNWNMYHYILTDIPITVTTMEFGKITPTQYGTYNSGVYKIEDINLAGTIIKYN